MKLDIGVVSHIGDKRRNEDKALVLMPANIFGVIDGMGGHQHGDLASKTVYDMFMELTYEDTPNINILAVTANRANAEVMRKNIEMGSNMGAVATIAWIDEQNGKVLIIHIGDTRAYIWSNGLLQQITRDHSMVAGLEEDKRIRDARRHIVTQSFGSQYYAGVSRYEVWFEPGDTLLICSDGMCDAILPPKINWILAMGIGAQKTAEALLEAVLTSDCQSMDNTTIVVVRALGNEPMKRNANPTSCPL